MKGSGVFNRLKTLIAEDDQAVSLIYKIGLTDQVFEKRFTADGNDVLEIYWDWRPDILILDIMLPGKSGYAALKAIRENMESADTVIIMATSLSDRDAVMDCLTLGIQGYLVKPFTHKEISRKVLACYGKTDHERATAALALLGPAASEKAGIDPGPGFRRIPDRAEGESS